jgi:hypothetical protein
VVTLHPSIAWRILREVSHPVEPPLRAVALTEREIGMLYLIARDLNSIVCHPHGLSWAGPPDWLIPSLVARSF